MSSISDLGPDGNGGPDSPLILLLDDQLHEIAPAQLRDEQFRQQIHQDCSAAGAMPVFMIGGLLDWDDGDRWFVFGFILEIPGARVRVAEDAAESLDLFEAVLESMVGDGDVEGCGRGRRAAIEAAALIHATNIEPAASRIASRLRELDVHVGRADSIAREIRELARSLRAIENPGQAGQQLVRDILDDAPVPELAIVPTGWQLDQSGVSRLGGDGPALVLTTPLVICRRFTNLSDSKEGLEIAYVRDDRWKALNVSRAMVATTRTIVDLAADGVPIHTINAADVVQYLADFEATNIEVLPRSYISQKLGWIEVDGQQAFLWGRELITSSSLAAQAQSQEVARSNASVMFVGADGGDEQVVDGFRAHGSDAGWFEALRPLCNYPRVQFAVYASLASPLLAILSAPNFTIHFAGPTSGGKTTVQRIAASCWGCPDERSPSAAIYGWDATRVFIERVFALLDCLPVILDDTRRAKKLEEAGQIVYDVASGRGRQRGTRQGIARSGTGHTVLISSGEAPLTTATQGGGAVARTLELWGGPFGSATADTARVVCGINDQIRENHGHAGPYFVRCLLANQSQWPAWRAQYEQFRQAYRDRAGDNSVALRMADNFATLEMAAWLAHNFGILPWANQGAISGSWVHITAETGEADRAAVALRYAVSWAHAHANEFYSSMISKDASLHGWAGRWDVGRMNHDCWAWLGIFPHRLEEILTAGGFDAEATIRNWHDREWLRVDRDGRRQFRTSVDGHGTRLFAIERAAIELVMGTAGATEEPAVASPGASPRADVVMGTNGLTGAQAGQGLARPAIPTEWENGNGVGSQSGRG